MRAPPCTCACLWRLVPACAARDVERSMREFNQHIERFSSVKLDPKLEDSLE